MNGVVFIIPGANYSTENIGQVTLLEDIAILSLSISGNAVVDTSTAQYTVVCTPSTTSQTYVDWSIDSGGQYAQIDSNGLLLVVDNITESVEVVIRATSIFNTNISATKTVRISSGVTVPVSVTYVNGSRKATITGINTSYTNMATFDNESLLDWTTNAYKVTVDSSYKVYFALVRPDTYRCGARSTICTAGTYDVSAMMESIKELLDTTVYKCFALVVVDADYIESGAKGSDVIPANISNHISIERI